LPRATEVNQNQFLGDIRNDQIRWFDVGVNDAAGVVQVAEPMSQLPKQANRLRSSQLAFPGFPHPLNPPTQVLTFDPLLNGNDL
jgi:hypothetical protein